jgi:hypothetical protein
VLAEQFAANSPRNRDEKPETEMAFATDGKWLRITLFAELYLKHSAVAIYLFAVSIPTKTHRTNESRAVVCQKSNRKPEWKAIIRILDAGAMKHANPFLKY